MTTNTPPPTASWFPWGDGDSRHQLGSASDFAGHKGEESQLSKGDYYTAPSTGKPALSTSEPAPSTGKPTNYLTRNATAESCRLG